MRSPLRTRLARRWLARRWLAATLVLWPGTAHAIPPSISPLESASTGGLATVDRALARLQTHQRLLVIAAHPDDEDTALLTWVARGLGGEAAYLSLSRGDGGQNLIGPELGPGLGLLRSRELQSARRIDGARQFFTRAYDFGYTRSLEETLERWPKEVLLEDAMRVVRRFKPQVIAAVFPPTPQAGHGQHQASGLVAGEVFELSADPAAFPELGEEGLSPWRVSTFYRSVWWNPNAATLELPLGTIEPFTGRSILQLALASRSQHRCQDMGSVQPLGDATGRLAWVAGAGGSEAESLFEGIDTRPQAIADALPEGQLRREATERLARVAEIATGTRGRLAAAEPGAAAAPLLEIVRLLHALEGDLAAKEDAAHRAVRELVAEKLEVATEGLAAAARLAIDAVAERPTVVPGQQLEVRSIFWNGGDLAIEDLDVTVVSPAGWQAGTSAPAEPARGRFTTQLTDERTIRVDVPENTDPTTPYFLRSGRAGDLYDWSTAPPDVRGEPFAPPPLSLRFAFSLAGVPLQLEREVVHRVGDQAVGEVRTPLRAVPELEVAVEPRSLVWSVGARKKATLRAEVRSNVERLVRVRLAVTTPEGWPEIEPIEVETSPARSRRTVEVAIEAPADLAPGRYEVALAVTSDSGARYDRALRVIDYEHVRPVALPEPARLEISAGDIRLPRLERLGYIRGASDGMPELLERIGLPVVPLSAADLAEQDLQAFDAIVVGSRAYEVDRALGRINDRLLDYARAGGLLIVQYQQYQFARGGHAPFPLEIRRPHDRITDETAPVTVLEPEHAVFTTPNRLGENDWRGWVQERGLYFAGTWDDAYQPLLAMADPDGEEKRGGLLVARLGEGHYVYCGLAFFRQLPAGVTGAYRLFVNLLALGEDSAERGST
ncbi:MAG: PIG-L family deacetylase [bacterium]|nr:PIG-L family deacetylase [bacterium]